jgi:hypothetical protein
MRFVFLKRTLTLRASKLGTSVDMEHSNIKKCTWPHPLHLDGKKGRDGTTISRFFLLVLLIVKTNGFELHLFHFLGHKVLLL